MIRIAIQAKGRLNEDSLELLAEAGMKISESRRKLLTQAEGFPLEVLYLEEEEAVLHFPTPIDVLHHLRMTGVTGTEKHTWSRGRLQTFCDEYRNRFGSAEGVSLTYQPIYVICRYKQ